MASNGNPSRSPNVSSGRKRPSVLSEKQQDQIRRILKRRPMVLRAYREQTREEAERVYGVNNEIKEDDEDGDEDAEHREPIGDDDEEEEDDDDDEEKEDEELLAPVEDEANNEQVNIDFRFCDARPEGEDELFIRALINNGFTGRLCGGEDSEIRALAKVVSEQVEIGTFVKTEGNDDDESIYSFVTVLNIANTLPTSLKQKISSLIPKNQKVGWVVREQIVNVPAEVTGPLYACLKDDLEWAEKEAKDFKYDSFVVFAPCYNGQQQQEANGDEATTTSKKKKKEKTKNDDANFEYALNEDLLFSSLAKNQMRLNLKRPAPREGVDEPESKNHAPWSVQVLMLDKKAFIEGIRSLSSI